MASEGAATLVDSSELNFLLPVFAAFHELVCASASFGRPMEVGCVKACSPGGTEEPPPAPALLAHLLARRRRRRRRAFAGNRAASQGALLQNATQRLAKH